MKQSILALVLVTLPLAGNVSAKTPGDLPDVRNGLIAVSAADTIRKRCDSISPRMMRAYSFIKSLESSARSQGFSRDEVNAFVKDKSAKRALESQANAYLAQNGVDPSVPATYCTVGRAEIAKNSAIGRLLRAN